MNRHPYTVTQHFPDALKPDPRDLAAVRAATLPRLLGIAAAIARTVQREGIDLSRRPTPGEPR